MSDHAALIAEARMVEGEADLYEQWPAGDVKALVAQLRAALEASQQAPTVDREALARELFIADNWGVPSGGADWDEGRVHESRIAQMYRLADGLIASGVLLDAAEVEARGLEKAAEAAFRVTANMHGGFSNWLNRRAQQVREGN